MSSKSMPLLKVLRNCNLYPAVAFTAQEKATPIKWSKRRLIKGKRSHCYDYRKKNKECCRITAVVDYIKRGNYWIATLNNVKEH